MGCKYRTGAAPALKEDKRDLIGANARYRTVACNRHRMHATEGISDCHQWTAATVCAAGLLVYLSLQLMQTNIEHKVSFQDPSKTLQGLG